MIAIRSRCRQWRRPSVCFCLLSARETSSSSSSLPTEDGSFDDDGGDRNNNNNNNSSPEVVVVRGTIPKFGYGVKVGQYAEIERIYTTEDIDKYGTLIQDKNILHSPMVWSQDLLQEHPYLQSNYDAGLIKLQDDNIIIDDDDDCDDDENPTTTIRTTTTKPLVHGMMVSSIFSSIFANLIPGCVYLNQSLNFVKPIFAEEVVVGRITIEKIRRYPQRRRRHRGSGSSADTYTGGGAGIVVQCDTTVYRLSHHTDDENDEKDNDSNNKYESSITSIKGNASVWLPSGYAGENE